MMASARPGPQIDPEQDLCTVIVTVDADPDLIPELEAHARLGLEQFPAYDGFVAGALHQSADGTRLVQYLQWRSAADHQACIEDPHWESVPSSKAFLDHVKAGRATIDVRTYRVVALAN
jgi:hypothetical protein